MVEHRRSIPMVSGSNPVYVKFSRIISIVSIEQFTKVVRIKINELSTLVHKNVNVLKMVVCKS